MNKAISIELQFFLISILWGAIILLVYDGLRILRRLIRHNSFFLALEDLVFWVLASVFIFAMIYAMNNGTIRGFSVMGMGIGMILYHYILSEPLVKWITKALLLLLRPIRLILSRIRKIVFFLKAKGKKATDYLFTRLKKVMKSVKIAFKKNKHKRALKRDGRRKAKAEKLEKARARKSSRKEKHTSHKNNTKKNKSHNRKARIKETNNQEQKEQGPVNLNVTRQQGKSSGRLQARQGSVPIRRKG